MNDSNSFGYQENGPGTLDPAPTPGPIPGNYKFSPDELRVLGECNQESFFKRSLPLGTAMGFTTFIAIQKGHLKPNIRFGVLPKVTLAVVMGYFIGKLSYQETCAEKLMALPGSYIGQLLKERKDGKVKGVAMKKAPPTMFGASQRDIYSDAGPGNSLDLDTDRPLFNEEAFRPTDTDGGVNANSTEPELIPRGPALSYDELRRQNRTQHSEAKQDPYKYDSSAMPPISRRPPPPPPSASTNKYGDVME